MRRYSLISILLIGALSLGLGSGATVLLAGSVLGGDSDVAGDRLAAASGRCGGGSARSPAHSPQLVAAGRALRTLLEGTSVARTYDVEDPDSWTSIHARARTDPATRAALIARHREASEGAGKQVLTQLLSALHTADVFAYGMDLSRASDAAQRRVGFELLAGMKLKLPEVRELAMGALKQEVDPAILIHAIDALEPAAVPPLEAEAVIEQLTTLTDHGDPGVRARAVNGLASWDTGGHASSFLADAVVDAADEVRWAAVSAVSQNRVRSDDLKQALMHVADDQEESADIRLAAAAALERFPLSAEEARHVVQVAVEADRNLYADPGPVEPAVED